MPERAQIRAPVTKSIVEMVDELPPADRDAIRRDAAAAIQTVADAPRTAYLPLGVQLEIMAAIDRRLGRPAYLEFCAENFGRTVETPLVRTIFDGATRIFGVGPTGIFKVFRKAWSMMSEGCGDVDLVTLSPSETRIVVEALPVDEKHIDLFVQGFAYTFRGVFDVFDVQGEMKLVSFDRHARKATYLGSWKA